MDPTFKLSTGILILLAGACASSISSILTAPYTSWFPIVILAVFAVIAILSIVYAISPLIGRSNIQSWIRVKIYDEILSVFLIIIFASFATSLCSINPVGILGSVNLLPVACNPNPTTASPDLSSLVTLSGGSLSLPMPNNLYSVSICDMYVFNNYLTYLNFFTFYAALITEMTPTLNFNYLGPPLAVQPSFAVAISYLPDLSGIKMGRAILNAVYGFLLVNDVQLIILSAAPLIFAIFMAIGLISRAFGIGRTFGGAMIAFAIGIGFVYPLLVSISYGFIDYGLTTVSSHFTGNAFVLPVLGLLTLFGKLAVVLINFISSSTTLSSPSAVFAIIPEYLFMYIGLISMGMLFIPFLNLVILNTFILDFSQALGERMDFLSLLTNII